MKRIGISIKSVMLAGLMLALPLACAFAATIDLPDRNPRLDGHAAQQSGKTATDRAAMPLPDRNPRLDPQTAQTPSPKPDQVQSASAAEAPAQQSSQAETDPAKPQLDFATILKPILAYSISDSDKADFVQVLSRTDAGDAAAAAAAIAQIKDPALQKLAIWYADKSNHPQASAETIEEFRIENPDWPGQDSLQEAAERRLFLSDADADAVFAFFQDTQPQTGAGKAALAGAYLAKGDKAKAETLLVSAWREHYLDEDVEKKILARFGGMLTEADDQARIDMLLYPDDPSLTAEAERIAKLLPESDRKTVAARIAVVKRKHDAGKLLDALPDDADKDDIGLLFNRIQYLRRSDHEEDAWKMLLSAPHDPSKLVDLEQWWIERRINCRAALAAHDYEIAYKLAAGHGPLTGDSYREAEFLAGWIALRFLHDPKTALSHFIALRSAADNSKSKARAEYWLGRTAEALGERNTAMLHFAAAARYPQHYYGQLGRQALDPKPARLEITPCPTPNQAEIDRFLNRDTVRAIGAADAAGYDQLSVPFYLALARRLNDPAEIVLLAELASRSGNQPLSVRVAKIAFNRDMPLGAYALPIDVIPNFVRLGDKVDMALIHALSRQESEFNADAKSPAGARGLMQLMPATARLVAREFNVKYLLSRLNDPSYNMQLGQAHLCDLIKRYHGSYFLALVAYNAGPGRVKEWIGEFGDPRDADVDPIDWVESIPYTETREYVMKIMESLQLYRSRLHGQKGALQLWQDLNRGRDVPAGTPETGSIEAKAD
jgi:peptidoglycan lytic transglycosylase